MANQQDQIFKKLTISSQLVRLAEFKARTLGLSFQDYIKYLITEDIQDILNKFKFLKEEEIELMNYVLDESNTTPNVAQKRRKELEQLLERWKPFMPIKK